MIIGITTTYVEEEQKDEIVPVERVTVEYVVTKWRRWPRATPPVEGRRGCGTAERRANWWYERLDGLERPAAGTPTRRRTATKRAWPKPWNVFDGRDALIALARLYTSATCPCWASAAGTAVLNVALWRHAVTQDVHAWGPPTRRISRSLPTTPRASVDIGPGSVLDRAVATARAGYVPGCKAGWSPHRSKRAGEGIATSPRSSAAGEHDAPLGVRLCGRPAAGERGQPGDGS